MFILYIVYEKGDVKHPIRFFFIILIRQGLTSLGSEAECSQDLIFLQHYHYKMTQLETLKRQPETLFPSNA